jgi:hypothetical protein
MVMSKLARILLVSACLVGLAAIAAYAAHQTILGKSFSVKAKPGNPTQSKVGALEKNSNDTLVGDPTATGTAGGATADLRERGLAVQPELRPQSGNQQQGQAVLVG